jgi:hypothetical protein
MDEIIHTPTPESEPNPEPETSRDERSKGARILREWGFDLDTFQARAKQSLGAARGDLSEVASTLRRSAAETKQVLLDLQKNRGPVATELKSGFERAWDELERAFSRAKERMQESPEASAAPASHDDAPQDAPPSDPN